MILYAWRGTTSNFGDELNTILWPRLLPGFFDTDAAIRFVGIGSVLDRRHPNEALKLVAGAGYGGYEGKPRLDKNWIIHWVRGPQTAATLGLPASLALGDPAVLVPSVHRIDAASGPPSEVGFMPHFESAARGAWQQAAALAGINFIDPRDPPLDVLAAIRRCKLLLSEAMHGVIVADACRVPWVAMRPLARIHRAKWLDWAATLDLRVTFHGLPVSSLPEWAATSNLGPWQAGVQWLTGNHRLAGMASNSYIARAAQVLRLAASAEPQLSTATAMDRCQSRMLDAVQAIRTQPMQVPSRRMHAMRARSRLQPVSDSAYQPT
jgi:succinoglycan biosynthesis protein ExoV